MKNERFKGGISGRDASQANGAGNISYGYKLVHNPED